MNAHPDRNAGHADGMARKLAALDVLAARRELLRAERPTRIGFGRISHWRCVRR